MAKLTLRTRILRVLTPEFGGERKRSVLAGIAGGEEKLRPVLGALMAEGLVRVRRCYGGQRYGLARQRGFEYVKLALILGIVLAVGAGVLWVGAQIKAYGAAEREAGKAEVMGLWQLEALEAAREDTEAARGRQAIGAAGAKTLQAANARAAQAEEDLRRHREENRDRPAATVEGCQPADGAARPVVRLNWGWVRDYDAAWTGAAGESVFGDRPKPEGTAGAADAASSYGLAELAGVHGDNAAKCSKIRRQLNELVDTLDRLEADFDAKRGGTQ